MSTKSDASLQEYIDLHKNYNPYAVDAAVKELQKRGRTIPEEQLKNLSQTFETANEVAEKEA